MRAFLPTVIALALIAAASATAVSRQDVDSGGNVYKPLLCSTKSQCGCNTGYVQCSTCPDDGGSANKLNKVCWCSDLPTGGNECNPAKKYGPYSKGGPAYEPITCSSTNDCACKWGNGKAKCSWCPNDEGSPTKYKNVCWCTGFWWNKSEVVCNSKDKNGPYRVDNNAGGNNMGGGNNDVPYNPIECKTDKQCKCDYAWNARAQCSWCPDDKGSPFQKKNVCWCDDAFGNGSGARECNPTKPGGPKKIDVDVKGYEYKPIVCDPKGSMCGCSLGTAKCGVCPFDTGSQWKGYNVCWCDFTGTVTKGFYPHGNNPSGECNPKKYKGPTKKRN